jgi:nucleotide-binding universal stress UspA family protein
MQATPQPVVVGIDGPADTVAAAIHLGAWEANRRHTGLRLVGTYGSSLPGHPDVDAEEFASRFTDELAAAVHQMHPEVAVDSAVRPGNAAHALIDVGRDATVIIVAGDARVHRGRIPGELVAAHVAAHAGTSVIVVPTPRDPRGTEHRVVVGVDTASGRTDAIEYAFDEAAARHATLHAVSVWEPATRHGFRPLTDPADLERLREGAEARLAGILAPWTEKYPDVPVVRDAVRHANPVQVLCQAAADAELVVAGSHGRSGSASVALGPVSAGLVRYSPTPVAVVHPVGGVR